MARDEPQDCSACGASIYKEHVESGMAGLYAGQMLCPHCMREKKEEESEEERRKRDAEALSPVALDEDMTSSSSSPGGTAIFGFSGSDSLAGASFSQDDESKFRRRLDPRSPFGTRCRTFHSKLSAGAVAYMNEQINQWADSNNDVQIKFATSCIGVFEGKHADPHLIITIFY